MTLGRPLGVGQPQFSDPQNHSYLTGWLGETLEIVDMKLPDKRKEHSRMVEIRKINMYVYLHY